MAITVTVQRVDSTQNQIVLDGILTFSGSYPAGGDVLNLAVDAAKTNAVNPIKVEVYENPAGATGAGAPLATGYSFVYVDGTSLANGRLQIFVASPYQNTGGTQVTAGTYAAAGLSVVNFRAYIPSFGS